MNTLATLERRVEERTKELAEANAALRAEIAERKRAEETLRESEEKFHLLADNIHDSFWIRSPDMKTLHYVSAGFEKIWGRPREALRADPDRWIDFIVPEDRERVSATYVKLMAHEAQVSVEYRITRPDGTVRWVQTRGFQVRDAAGKLVRLTGVVTDITDRKQAEEAMRESERELQGLAESMPQLVWKCQPDGWQVYFNQRWYDYTGMTQEESQGHGWRAALHPEDRPRAAEEWKRATENGAAYDLECRLRDRHGNYRWFLIRGVRLCDEGGEVLSWTGTCTDIEEQKKNEEALRLLSSAVEQAMESIVITDAQLDLPGPRILFVNPAFSQMTGYSLEEVAGKTPRMLQGPATNRAVLDRLRQRLTRGEPFKGETVNYGKDRKGFNVEWQIAPIRDPKGNITHFVSFHRNITEQKRAEAALAEMHKQLVETSRLAGMSEVATNVLHNIGNVLNSVNTSIAVTIESVRTSKISSLAHVVALLQEHEADLGNFLTTDPRGKRLPDFLAQLSTILVEDQTAVIQELQSLRGNIEHINGIVAMQQNYARISGIKEIVDVRELVEDSVRMNVAGLDRHGVSLIREYQDVPPMNLEKHKILQILVNLVANAKNACDESGKTDKQLTVRLAHVDDRVRISVADNGVGIPAENLTRIFNHGFTTRKDGHGFGLHSGAIAAQEMGGSLTVRSDGLGHGAVFTLELPCPSL